ncbi:MAG TPA: DUF4249 domain-containing protein [Puia sp.]|nr:DUF4249 domain-containing protein [Puia sp.]
MVKKASILLLCCIAGLIVSLLTRCRRSYDPPAISAANNYLVVDGFINTGANAVTTFKLNTSVSLNDTTTTGKPVFDATVNIVASNGQTWPLVDTGNNGSYSSAPLNLDITQQYSLSISTQNGQRYSSDPVPCKQTPAIDSVWWRQPGNLDIDVTTHDPTGNTRYYRYDYVETWQHDAQLQSVWVLKGDSIQFGDSTNQKYECWITASSTGVLLATSAGLTQDLISGYTVNTIPAGDPRPVNGYSILVHQYALTEGAYNYWQLIQKTTDNVGTLFDVQPTQLIGNIHCTTNPAQPVIGYISACSVRQQRIFILAYRDLQNWQNNQPGYICGIDSIPQNTPNPLIWNYPDTLWAPWYFVSNGPLVIASRVCLDCTFEGGTNIKPSFWPWP